MPTQFDHLIDGELRTRLLSSEPAQFAEAVGEILSALNGGRKKGHIPAPADSANLATYDERLLGVLWGLARNIPAFVELLRRHGLPYEMVPEVSTCLDERDLGRVYRALGEQALELVWTLSRDSSALEALWLSDRTLDREPPPDSVLAFRWWHSGDARALERLLGRLGLRLFVIPDLAERCVTPENQARLLDRYGQIALPPGSGTIDEFASFALTILLERIRTYWDLYRHRSARRAFAVWVRSRVADRANRGKLERGILRRLAVAHHRRNRLPVPLPGRTGEPGRTAKCEACRTAQGLIRLATLVRNRAQIGYPGWSDEELRELACTNLLWVRIKYPSESQVREAREVIAEDTAGWGPGSVPTEDEIRDVFGWFPRFGPRVAEQVVLRDQLSLALDAAVSGLAPDECLWELREEVLGRMKAAIDWVRDQRRYLRRPVPEFARLLLGAQELWWAVASGGARERELQTCRVLFELFCRGYRAARVLAPCYLLGEFLERGLPSHVGAEVGGTEVGGAAAADDEEPAGGPPATGVRSALRGHPTLVRWLEEGRWRDNFELPRSKETRLSPEAVRQGVLRWLEPRTRLGPSVVRTPRQLLVAWLKLAPAEADFPSETAALDSLYWSQRDQSNQARWALLRAERPAPGQAEWPRLDGIAVHEMIEAGSGGAWLRVADLATDALPGARVNGDRRWSPALELESALRTLGAVHEDRRRALRRCRELFGELPADLRGGLSDLGVRMADDTWWTAPDLSAGPGWHENLEGAAARAPLDVQCRLNLLRLWLSVCLRPEGGMVYRLDDLDSVWAETGAGQAEAKGVWKSLGGRLPPIIANASRGNWRAVSRLCGNALADVPDGPGRAAAVFSALRRLAEGEPRAPAPAAEGGIYE